MPTLDDELLPFLFPPLSVFDFLDLLPKLVDVCRTSESYHSPGSVVRKGVPSRHFDGTAPTPTLGLASQSARGCSAICADRHSRSAMVVKLWLASTATKNPDRDALHLTHCI